jgi:2-keto-4-pentenoate hydratase
VSRPSGSPSPAPAQSRTLRWRRIATARRGPVAESQHPVSPALEASLREQLTRRRALLDAGARPVGWKLGMGQRERIDAGPAIGHLTSATRLAPGAEYRARDSDLHADAEVALRIGRAVSPSEGEDRAGAAIAGYGAALELVDLAGTDDPSAIVADNVFHRAFAVTGWLPRMPSDVEASLWLGDQCHASGVASTTFADRVLVVATLLDAVGERLCRGDVLITGSVVQIRVPSGRRVTADLGPLGRVALRVR